MDDRARVEKMLTTVELAELLQLPPQTLKEWRTTGRGPAFYRIGKHVRYRQADVAAFLAGRRAA